MATVSVAIPYASKWYFEAALRGMRAAAAEDGHELDVWVEAPGPAARAAVATLIEQHLADSACIGAIAVHFRLHGDQVGRVLRSGKPVVLVGGRPDELPVVRLDDVEVARRAVQHLIDLGHRDIAHLAGAVTDPDDITIRADRVRGYSEAMRDAGLEMQASVRASAFDVGEATSAALRLLSADERPTAVFAAVDEMALGVLDAARTLGLAVPRDLSVIGIDDHDDSAAAGLTTMRQSPEAVGRAAVARLLGRTDVDDQVMDVELVVRTSTAPPPGPVAARPQRGLKRGLLDRLVRRR
ncbi:LacI family DNA-binding transcriptional regulator [Amnibacterium endophyticum]|uniref:LacI family DNA-binding transcriptional regulator n=1 Tax=Amnibacterium endophyticum TaxID=2109337 RepID=A0ABW4LDD4_9MICO